MAYAYVEFENKNKPHAKQYQRGYLGASWTNLFFGFYPSIYRSHLKTMLIQIMIFVGLGTMAILAAGTMGFLAASGDVQGVGMKVAMGFMMTSSIVMFLTHLFWIFFFNRFHRNQLLKDGYEITDVKYFSYKKNKKYNIAYEVKNNKARFTKVSKEIENA